MVAEKKIDPKICYVIWTTPVYPDYNWTAHPDLDRKFGEGMIDRLQKTMIEMTDSDLLKAINRQEGLIPAKNEEWDDLAGLAKELGLLR